MSKGPQWMDSEELEGWAIANANGGGPASPAISTTPGGSSPDTSARKLSATKLGLALLASANQGDELQIKELLAMGAQVNCRARASPGATPYRVAIELGHEKAALALLEAGGVPQPDRCYNLDSEGSVAFTKATREGAFSPEMRKELSVIALKLFVSHGKSWLGLVKARDLLPVLGARDDALLMRACFDAHRLDLALQGFRAGVPVDERCWIGSGERSTWGHGLSGNHERRRTPLLAFLAEPTAVASMDAATCEALFSGAMMDDDVAAARALLGAGLRPSPDWTVKEPAAFYRGANQQLRPRRQGFLALAAARERPEMWDLAKRCPPAIAAANRAPESPASLRFLSTGRLLEYAELAPIDARGPGGRSLTHFWALASTREPRDGWATAARKFPDLFDARDDEGQTGYGLQASMLDAKAKDAFLSSLSRIEKREVTRQAPAASAPAPKARPRL